jgi:hypothetical protein
MSFASLKQSSQDSLRKLTEQVNKLNNTSEKNKDEGNFWKPTVDKAGNGSAILRFLPAPDGEDTPFVRYWDHGFQGPNGKWYIEKSRTSLGDKDPVAEYNSKLWRESDNDDSPQRKQARKQKRREHYVANVYVVKDPGNPENNGKVFLYDFGKKIWNKLNELMYPMDDGIEEIKPVDPFNMWTGADFYLRIRQVDGYRNYDKSSFGDSKPLLDDDDAREAIWKSEYPLKDFVDPAHYKSYAELEKRLNEVLDLNTQLKNEDDAYRGRQEAPAGKTAKASYEESVKEDEDLPWSGSSASTDDDDDDMAFFKKLAQED